MKLELILQLAGLLQLGLIIPGSLMPGAVGLRKHVAVLPPFIRNLFWVYYGFIGLCLLSLGLITTFNAAELAAGSGLARGFCWFLAVFWMLRLFVAVFLFDVRPYLTNWAYRVGYQITNVIFAILPFVFIWAAVKGGSR